MSRVNNYQQREAARIGRDETIRIHDCRENNASWVRQEAYYRELRAENARRAAAAA